MMSTVPEQAAPEEARLYRIVNDTEPPANPQSPQQALFQSCDANGPVLVTGEAEVGILHAKILVQKDLLAV